MKPLSYLRIKMDRILTFDIRKISLFEMNSLLRLDLGNTHFFDLIVFVLLFHYFHKVNYNLYASLAQPAKGGQVGRPIANFCFGS